VLGGGVQWRHLANTIEPSMFRGDVAFFLKFTAKSVDEATMRIYQLLPTATAL